jgi:hypothetical protein
MMIYNVTHPMLGRPIGKMHDTLEQAHKAALRAAKRLGHAQVKHWRHGLIETVFPDGMTVEGTDKGTLA